MIGAKKVRLHADYVETQKTHGFWRGSFAFLYYF